MFKLWSADELPGEMHAIITILLLWCLFMKESRRIKVSFEARKGTWSALSSMARMHSFRASKLNSQRKVPFVDFSSLHSPLSVVALSILGPLAACQINQYQSGNIFFTALLDVNLRMSPRVLGRWRVTWNWYHWHRWHVWFCLSWLVPWCPATL